MAPVAAPFFLVPNRAPVLARSSERSRVRGGDAEGIDPSWTSMRDSLRSSASLRSETP